MVLVTEKIQSRKLGYLETFLAHLADKGAGTGQLSILCSIKGVLSKTIFLEALHTLYHSHPLLRATLNRSESGYALELNAQFHDVPITNSKIPENKSPNDFLEEELNTPLSPEKALWRVLLLRTGRRSNTLIVTFHHSISDAFSGVAFIQDFLAVCSRLRRKEETTEPELSFLPSIESLTSPPGTTIRSDFSYDPITYERTVPLPQRRTKCLYTTIKGALFKNLVSCCKKENVTINSVLSAAMLLTLQKDQNKQLHTSLLTPVDLRKYTQGRVSPKDIGCYASVVRTDHPHLSSKTDFWDLARDYQSQLKERFSKEAFFPKDFSPKEIFSETHQKPEFSSGIIVSNLGRIGFPEQHPPYQVESFRYALSRNLGDCFCNLLISTLEDKMELNFCYCSPLVSDTRAHTFFFSLIDTLRAHTFTPLKIHTTLLPKKKKRRKAA